jgi:dGTPase
VNVSATARNERYRGPDPPDQRTEAQRDRDRILYCSAFRRLAEVTQVVSALEGPAFHNRLTHTLKVAQIARRLAEKLSVEQREEAAAIGGPDPDVTETAALGHDLGHPPFGHIAEETLRELADDAQDADGFDGNAQSFRIVTKLAVRTDHYPGLNLTAASLNGILKYPWTRATRGEHRRKWGAYFGEKTEFEWARNTMDLRSDVRTVEAELMDWADDIAYSVFDVDDFYRAGLIPLDRIFADQSERERFLESAKARLIRWGKKNADEIAEAFLDLIPTWPPRSLGGEFRGTSDQRALMRVWTSKLVARYVKGIMLHVPSSPAERTVRIAPALKNEVEILKQLVWTYVIENPRLLTQQHGEKTVVRNLFRLFRDKADERAFDIFPEPYCAFLRKSDADGTFKEEYVRIVIDMIASMTERQAFTLHNRLFGVSIGSIHDHL